MRESNALRILVRLLSFAVICCPAGSAVAAQGAAAQASAGVWLLTAEDVRLVPWQGGAALLAVPGPAEAAAIDEAGRVLWRLTGPRLEAQGLDGEALAAFTLAPAERGPALLVAGGDGRSAYLARGSRLERFDLSGSREVVLWAESRIVAAAVAGDRLWAATERELFRFDATSQVRQIEASSAVGVISALAAGDAGAVWVFGSSGAELLSRDGLRLARRALGAGLEGALVLDPASGTFRSIAPGAARALAGSAVPRSEVATLTRRAAFAEERAAMRRDEAALAAARKQSLEAQSGSTCARTFVPYFAPGSALGLDTVGNWTVEVRSTVVFDDGSGPALFAAGRFHYAGGQRVDHIAKWDGHAWQSVRSPFDLEVFDLTVFDDGHGARLYAAGIYLHDELAERFAVQRFDGEAWESVGLRFSHQVTDLEVFDDGTGPGLYAAGPFDQANLGGPWGGGSVASSVAALARFDGDLWQPVAGHALTAPTGLVAVGSGATGRLLVRDDQGVWSYDGNAFSLLGAMPNPGKLAAVATPSGPLVFAAVGNEIRRYQAGSWSTLAGLTATVRALLAVPAGTGAVLYAAGDIDGTSPTRHLARHEAGSWSVLDAAGEPALHHLAWLGLGGQGSLWGGGALNVWSRGASWQPLGGPTTDGAVEALATFDEGGGEGLFVAGSFTRLGPLAASHLARRDASGSWSAVGAGLNGPVHALATFAGELYAAGEFSAAGALAASNIARWDGSAWAAVGEGLAKPADALAVADLGDGPALFAAGGDRASCCGFVARWDGTSWVDVGGAINGRVRALAASSLGGPGLLAGGDFTAIGPLAAKRVARLAGSSWSALGDGTSGSVYALAEIDLGTGRQVYAGGTFTLAGNLTARRVARWDGAAWSALGSGLGTTLFGAPDVVRALVAFDDGNGALLYAGGDFSIGGTYLARYNGFAWETPYLGGVDDDLYALLPATLGGGQNLVVAGLLGNAGQSGCCFDGVPSRGVGAWVLPASCPPPAIALTDPPSGVVTAQPTWNLRGETSGPGQVWVNGRPAPLADDATFLSPPYHLHEGVNELNLTFRPLNDFEVEAPAFLELDTTPPELSFLEPKAGAVVLSARPPLRLSVADAGSGLEESSLALNSSGAPFAADCSLHGGLAVCNPAADLPAGAVSLSATIADRVGNRGTAPPLALTIAPVASAVTTVTGRVELPDGTAAGGVAVSILGHAGASVTTDAAGTFTFAPLTLATTAPLVVVAERATPTEPQLASATVVPVPGGITEVGALRLEVGCRPTFGGGSPSVGAGGVAAPRIQALAVFDDGSGPALYAGGEFTAMGGVAASYLAKWTGSAWQSVGAGLNGQVHALAVWNDGTGPALYVGGAFSTAGGVPAARLARWNGAVWSAVGGGVASLPPTKSWVRALHVWDDGTGPALFVGGLFSSAGGVAASNIAKWNGAAWSSLGQGVGSTTIRDSVYALAHFDDGGGEALYVAGAFNLAGGAPVNRLARWSGASWSSVGGVGLCVQAAFSTCDQSATTASSLAVFDDGSGPALYVGGLFAYAGATVRAEGVARFDGHGWSAVGEGLHTVGVQSETAQGVQSLFVWNDGGGARLYAAGEILDSGSRPLSHLARFDGASWEPVLDGLSAGGYGGMALASFGGELIVGGGFQAAGGSAVNGIARFDGRRFAPLGASGTVGAIHAMVLFDDGSGPALYAGGDFLAIEGVTARRIARFDGNRWTAVGDGFSATVRALAVWNDGGGARLFAGGDFQRASGDAFDGIAAWNGRTWQEVGGGLAGGGVRAILGAAVGGPSRLFATGAFTLAGGSLAQRIAAFDGSQWLPLGTGLNREGRALLEQGGTLIVGGAFTSAGPAAASRIARWNGSSWSAFGTGLDDTVNALALFDRGTGPELIAAGKFLQPAGSTGIFTLQRVARWDGSAWKPLAGGLTSGGVSEVFALALYDDGRGPALIAGGTFSNANGLPAANLARWDGTSWSALGSGTNGAVRALLAFAGPDGKALGVGGDFGQAGDLVAQAFTRWGVPRHCATAERWDLAPPSIAFTAPAAAALLTTRTPELSLAYGDTGSGVNLSTLLLNVPGFSQPACTVGPSAAVCVSPPLGEGSKTFTATIADRVGNTSAPASLTVTIDTVAPALSFTKPAANALVRTATPRFDLSFSDATSGALPASLVLTSAGSPLAVTCTTTASTASCTPVAALADGPITVAATIADLAGLVSQAASVSFVIATGAVTIPDTVPPVLSFLVPTALSVMNPNAEPVRLMYGDNGRGVVPASLAFTVNGLATDFDCSTCATGAFCRPQTPLAGDVLVLSATIADGAGNVSLPAEVRFTTRPGVDITPPKITLVAPVPGSLLTAPPVTFSGSLSEAASLTLNGSPVAVAANLTFTHGPLALAEGANAFTLLATDAAGNQGRLDLSVTLDSYVPPPVDATKVSLTEPTGGLTTVTGGPGAVTTARPHLTVLATNLATGATATAAVAADGSFGFTLAARGTEELALKVRATNGNESEARSFTVPGAYQLPADPATIAPPVNATVAYDPCRDTAFLYQGGAVQSGTLPGALDCRRAAVLRGRVLDAGGAPVAGALIRPLLNPAWGSTLSRADGRYDLVAQGGGDVQLEIRAAGFLPVHRAVPAGWRRFHEVPEVVLTHLDSAATPVTLGAAAPAQIARGAVVTDEAGSRRLTLLIPAGTSAVMKASDGTSTPLSSATLRATEYTRGARGEAAMPAPLPARSGYTYAAELSLDEALSATEVTFDKPLAAYLENFLALPTGTLVPAAAYDRGKTRWVPSGNGLVVEVLAHEAGLAVLDVDGSGTAAAASRLSALGISDTERGQLATLYAPGARLWRVPIRHFTPWDLNLPVQPTEGAKPPKLPPAKAGDSDKRDDPCAANGSIIECDNQVLGEDLGIAGTGLALHYRSDRVPGRKIARRLDVPLTAGPLPPGLKRVELEVEIAGQTASESFAPAPDLSTRFTWDGKDAYGRSVQGRQPYTASVGYVYDALYQDPDACGTSPCFGLNGTAPLGPARGEVTYRQRHQGFLGSWSALDQLKAGGWSLTVHHAFDPNDHTLYLGDGSRRSIGNAKVIRRLAGGNGGGETGDGTPAAQSRLAYPRRLALAPPAPSVGSPKGGEGFYVLDAGNCKAKLITWEGQVRTVAGAGCDVGTAATFLAALDLNGTPATSLRLFQPWDLKVDQDGSLYILDRANWVPLEQNPDAAVRIYRVDPAGLVEVVDNAPGQDFGPMAIDRWDTLVRQPGSSSTVLRLDGLNGHLPRYGVLAGRSTVPPYASGSPTFWGRAWEDHREPSHNRMFRPAATALAFDAEGNLYANDGGRILRITWDGWVEHVAGDFEGNTEHSAGHTPPPPPFLSGDGCSADGLGSYGLPVPAPGGCPERGGMIDATGGGMSFAQDGSLLLADVGNGRIRKVDPWGMLSTVAGDGLPAAGSEEGSAALTASLTQPIDVLAVPNGDLIVAELAAHRLREVGSPVKVIEGTEIHIPSDDGQQTFVFDGSGRHLRTLATASGRTLLTFGYNAAGLLTTLTDAKAQVVTLERDGAGNVARILAPLGQVTTLAMNAQGYLAQVTHPLGDRVEMSYTPDGLLTSLTDPKGAVTTFTYDAEGRLIKDQDPLGGFTALTRTELAPADGIASGSVITKSSAMGRTSVFRTEQRTDGSEHRTLTAPDGTALLIVKRANGAKVTTYPDGTVVSLTPAADPRHGALVPIVETATVTTPAGLSAVTTSQRTVAPLPPFGPVNPLTLVTDDAVTVEGRTTRSHYEAATGVMTVTSPMGRQGSATRDLEGRLLRSEQPGLTAVTLAYDALGRPVSVTQGARTSTTTYTASGEVASVTDALGRTATATYDADGRVTSETLPDGRVIGYSYDLNGNVTRITPPSRPGHGFAYDATDRAKEYQPPSLGAGDWGTLLTYNLDHQVTLVTRPDGQVIENTYDPVKGRLTSTTTPRGTYTPAYNPLTGNLTSITDPSGGSLSFTYDGSLPLSVTWAGAVSGSLSSSYNNLFQVTERKINGGNAVAYQYNLDGQLTQAGPLSLSYDAVTGFPTGSTLGATTDAVTFSSFGELATFSAKHGATELLGTTFSRDKLGRLTGKEERIGGATTSYAYSYSDAGQLTQVRAGGVMKEGYNYDGNSNRTTWTDPWGDHTATYDAQDRLLTLDGTSYTYNRNGELATKTANGQTVSYDYDATGQLLGVDLPSGISIDYVLDAANRRVGKKVNGTLVQGFLWAGGNVVAELDGAGNVVSNFIYARKGHVPEAMIKGGVNYRIVTDHLGSVRLVVNSATGEVAQRLDYSAFGRVMLNSNPDFQPFGFAGGLFDTQTGLVRFGARDYDPEAGRWTSKDPIGFAGGDTNLYGYVLGDPVNLADPSGLAFSDFAWGFLKGAAVGVTFVGAVIVFPELALGAAILGTVGAAYTAFQGYQLFTDPCATAAQKHEFLGGLAGGLAGGAGAARGLKALASLGGLEAAEAGAASFGPSTVGAAQRIPKVLQTSGNTIRQRTADALNEFAGTNHHRRVWGRALEGLKKYSGLDNDNHGKILDNGDFLDKAGEAVGNIIDFLPGN